VSFALKDNSQDIPEKNKQACILSCPLANLVRWLQYSAIQAAWLLQFKRPDVRPNIQLDRRILERFLTRRGFPRFSFQQTFRVVFIGVDNVPVLVSDPQFCFANVHDFTSEVNRRQFGTATLSLNPDQITTLIARHKRPFATPRFWLFLTRFRRFHDALVILFVYHAAFSCLSLLSLTVMNLGKSPPRL
jgi:hypothetical protein